MPSCLLVDDSRVVRIVARKIFEDLHFSCDEAENGQEALDKIAVESPDVVFLDWNMPVMSGIECVVRIRSMTLFKQPKVIFCTTENDFGKITEALTKGADEYIMKPFDGDAVKSKLAILGLL
ncbi:MAG: response regulator [Alphaproteobacteria bacterium]|jgi:two-component system chemotaxis response regulator CheY|nr:response regulator [Thalassospira sp.]MCE2965192.1 response regulator [Alphaproteobacteria bacterium]